MDSRDIFAFNPMQKTQRRTARWSMTRKESRGAVNGMVSRTTKMSAIANSGRLIAFELRSAPHPEANLQLRRE